MENMGHQNVTSHGLVTDNEYAIIVDNPEKRNVTFRGLINANQYAIIVAYSAEFGTLLSLMGIISNIVNIRTFIFMGITDGVIVSFLSLAIFDLMYLIASVSLGISISFYVIELTSTVRFPIDPYAVSMFFGNVLILINITNVLTTTFIAVARCMCVARPLQFKNTFTKSRAMMVVTGIAIFSVVMYTPILANMGIRNKYDALTNTSRPTFWVSRDREHVKEIVWIVTEMLLPLSTQFIIIVCVVIMITSLRAASKFRQSSYVSEKTRVRPNSSNANNVKARSVVNQRVDSDKLTGKDLRVVQQVVLISVVYIACNTPKLLISAVTIIEPRFAIGKVYSRIYLCVNALRKHFEILNSAVNLIIYYKYNTKFRERL